MGYVARGGLRWSDRREDFRTEVLGLMKAQNVKNTLIVPVGAKGGFVAKRLPAGTREEVQAEVVACYQTFIRGLLDLTDNIRRRAHRAAGAARARDGDDTYLWSRPTRAPPPSPTSPMPSRPNTASGSDGVRPPAAPPAMTTRKWPSPARGGWNASSGHFREIASTAEAGLQRRRHRRHVRRRVGNGMLLSRHIRLQAALRSPSHHHRSRTRNPR